MEYLQYLATEVFNQELDDFNGFKPYYKWNTFNTYAIIRQ